MTATVWLTGTQMSELSDRLNYDREVIRVWFCNKRQALKNTIKKLRTQEWCPADRCLRLAFRQTAASIDVQGRMRDSKARYTHWRQSCIQHGRLCWKSTVAETGNKSATTWIRQFVAVDFVADTFNSIADTVDFVASVYRAYERPMWDGAASLLFGLRCRIL